MFTGVKRGNYPSLPNVVYVDKEFVNTLLFKNHKMNILTTAASSGCRQHYKSEEKLIFFFFVRFNSAFDHLI